MVRRKSLRRKRNTHSRNHKSRKYRRRQHLGGDSSEKAVVCVLKAGGGFFSLYLTLLRACLYAKKQKLPFFIDDIDWQYKYKDGWHDYFKGLNVLNREEQFSSIERFENGASNDIMDALTVEELIQTIQETFVLNDTLQASVDSYIKGIGGDYTSLYVRRGDKIKEMELISLDDILAQTTIQDDGRTIFVQTDDYSVVKDMKSKFPSCNIMTLTKENASGANNRELVKFTPEQRKEHTEELLISTVVSARANAGWSYHMSNVGMFIKLMGHNNIHLYTDKRYNKEEVDKAYALTSTWKGIMDVHRAPKK